MLIFGGKDIVVWILSQLVPKLRYLSGLESDPNILIIHCGANSLGMVQLQPILNQLQSAVSEISKLFPKAKIVWSCLLPRMVWRYTQNVKAMEKARARLNREAIGLVSNKGGAYIKHPQFDQKPVQLFHADGVHLSQFGNDLF